MAIKMTKQTSKTRFCLGSLISSFPKLLNFSTAKRVLVIRHLIFKCIIFNVFWEHLTYHGEGFNHTVSHS
jgi:hypothetical protein